MKKTRAEESSLKSFIHKKPPSAQAIFYNILKHTSVPLLYNIENDTSKSRSKTPGMLENYNPKTEKVGRGLEINIQI